MLVSSVHGCESTEHYCLAAVSFVFDPAVYTSTIEHLMQIDQRRPDAWIHFRGPSATKNITIFVNTPERVFLHGYFKKRWYSTICTFKDVDPFPIDGSHRLFQHQDNLARVFFAVERFASTTV